MKRVFGISFSVIIFLIYFVYATKGNITTIFIVLFPSFHIVLAASMFVTGNLYLHFSNMKKYVPQTLSTVIFYSLPIAMTVTCVVINLLYIIAPQPDDGIHYVWLSKLIASGRLYMELPHFYEHHINNFVFTHEGRYLSIFLPGYSFFMIPFSKTGGAFLFNPVIAGINTYLVGKHAESLEGRSAGIAAMLLFAFSTTHIFHGALYFPHHFGLMLVLISTYIIVHRSDNLFSYFIAGAVLSISLFIRPQNAAYTYFATVVFMFFSVKKIKPLIMFTIPFFVSGALLGYYNYYFTGNPFVFVQDLYFNAFNLNDFCHRPGFGKGCTEMPGFGSLVPPQGVTFLSSLGISFTRLNDFLFRISAHPLMLLFIFFAVIKKPFKYFIYYFMPICAFLAYFTFFIEGGYSGPRYYLESGALFLIASACGFSIIYKEFLEKTTPLSRFAAGSLAGFFLASLISFSFILMPASLFKNEFSDDPLKIEALIKETEIKNSIILLPPHQGFIFASNLTLHENPPFDKYGNMIMYSLSILDENIQKFYKGGEFKSVWRITRQDNGFSADEIGFMDDDGRWGLLFSLKGNSVKGTPKFIYPLFKENPDARFSYEPVSEDVFTYIALGILFDERDESYYSFEHSIKNRGEYDITVAIATTLCTTGFDITVNGELRGSFKPQTKEIKKVEFGFRSPLNEGKNSFSIVPHDKGCLILDYMLINKAVDI